MKISEILERLDSFDDGDREKHLRPLVAMLSPVSHQDIKEYQESHFTKYPEKTEEGWQEFIVGMNAVLRKCIELEVSEVIGKPVREALSLEPITLETEIDGLEQR